MRVLLLTLAALGSVYCQDTPPTCMNARNRCVSRIGCSMALNNFHIACEEVKLGGVNHCTDLCMRAVVSLVTVDDDIGTEYLTCDCAGNSDCLLWKKRIAMCSDDVIKALDTLDNDDAISCSLARMLCEADTQCWTAMSYYESYCSDLWFSRSSDNLECSAKCNNSLSILYRQTRAAKLKNCLCDNTDPVIDENTCLRMRYNTQTYCLQHQPDKSIISNTLNVPSDTVQDKSDNFDATMKVVLANSAPVKNSATTAAFSLGALNSLLLVLVSVR